MGGVASHAEQVYVSTGAFPHNKQFHDILQSLDERGALLFAGEEQVDAMMRGRDDDRMTRTGMLHVFGRVDEDMCEETRRQCDWAIAHIDEILADMLAQGWIRVHDPERERQEKARSAQEAMDQAKRLSAEIVAHLQVEYYDGLVDNRQLLSLLPRGAWFTLVGEAEDRCAQITVTSVLAEPLRLPQRMVLRNGQAIPIKVRGMSYYHMAVTECKPWGDVKFVPAS